jgi:hypothetical protein
MFCGSDSVMQNIPHIQLKDDEYFVPHNTAMGLKNVMAS